MADTVIKTPETAQKSVKFEVVSLATPFPDVVRYDRDRSVRVRFDANPGSFIELTPGQLNQLGQESQLAYSIARDEHTARVEESGEESVEDVIARIKTGYEGGNAAKRVEIRNERAGFKYRWIRPDMVDEYLADKGYTIVQNGPERTMANPSGKGPHIIARDGATELTLVMRSVQLERVDRDAKRAASKKLRDETDQGHEAAMQRDGFTPVTDGTPGNFAAIRQGDE